MEEFMAKDDLRVTNNPKLFEQVIEAAKRAVKSEDTSDPRVADKIDQIVSTLETQGKNPEQGRKADKKGTEQGYDEAVDKPD